MFETLKNAFKVKDIRKKLFITLLLLLAYRVCCYIPVPGLDSSTFTEVIEDNTFLELMNSVTGGSLANGTLFALGIGPYINASIIMQLLCVGIPALERMSKQGEEGKRKISQITRFVALGLAIIQAIGIILTFGDSALLTNYFWDQKWLLWIFMVVVYSAGAMLTIWLGERITEYGIGNGISLIIFLGIISTAADTLIQTVMSAFPATNSEITTFDFEPILQVIIFCILAVFIFTLIVTVDLAERRIPVQYAKQMKGRKMYGGQSTVIPIKISGSGVMPLIFSFAILSLPDLIMGLFFSSSSAYAWYTENFSGGSGILGWLYILILCLLIFAFSFFYAQIQFNPDDVSRSIQQNGGFIPGIRPGKPTADYLKKISNRITLFGAIYLSLVAFVPSLIFSFVGNSDLLSVFSTTGILIVVSVALEFDKQLQSALMMKNYKGFLK